MSSEDRLIRLGLWHLRDNPQELKKALEAQLANPPEKDSTERILAQTARKLELKVQHAAEGNTEVAESGQMNIPIGTLPLTRAQIILNPDEYDEKIIAIFSDYETRISKLESKNKRSWKWFMAGVALISVLSAVIGVVGASLFSQLPIEREQKLLWVYHSTENVNKLIAEGWRVKEMKGQGGGENPGTLILLERPIQRP